MSCVGSLLPEAEVSQEVEVRCPEGIHMRIAAEMITKAASFNAEWRIEKDVHRASGKSVMQVLALGACLGSKLTLIASGPQAGTLLEKLIHIVTHGLS